MWRLPHAPGIEVPRWAILGGKETWIQQKKRLKSILALGLPGRGEATEGEVDEFEEAKEAWDHRMEEKWLVWGSRMRAPARGRECVLST